jgi:hypothetical protein
MRIQTRIQVWFAYLHLMSWAWHFQPGYKLFLCPMTTSYIFVWLFAFTYEDTCLKNSSFSFSRLDLRVPAVPRGHCRRLRQRRRRQDPGRRLDIISETWMSQGDQMSLWNRPKFSPTHFFVEIYTKRLPWKKLAQNYGLLPT